MKKILIAVFSLLTCGAFAQSPVKNGTIYKEHPYITVVNNSIELFKKQDWDGMTKLFADTVKFYDPSSPKAISLADEKRGGQAFTTTGTKLRSPNKAIRMLFSMIRIPSRCNHGGLYRL